MAYVKIDAHLGFLLDPNMGIIEINGEGVEEKLYALALIAAQKHLKAKIKDIKEGRGDNELNDTFYRFSGVQITDVEESELYEIFSRLNLIGGIQFRSYQMREPA